LEKNGNQLKERATFSPVKDDNNNSSNSDRIGARESEIETNEERPAT